MMCRVRLMRRVPARDCVLRWDAVAAGVASVRFLRCGAWGSRSGGRLEELLDSRDDELWLFGLDEVRRVDAFVAPVGQAVGVAALVLADGGVLALPPFSGAGRRQHDRR